MTAFESVIAVGVSAVVNGHTALVGTRKLLTAGNVDTPASNIPIAAGVL